MASESEKGTKLVFNGKISQPSLVDNITPANPVTTVDVIDGLQADKPITMFPIRLETKYLATADPTKHDLWIRIFPDQILAKTHEVNLTPDEIAGGQNYWTVYEDNDDELTLKAWTKLCKSYRAPRAGYIIKMTKPELSETGYALTDAIGIYTSLIADIQSYIKGVAQSPVAATYLNEVLRDLDDALDHIESQNKAPVLLIERLQHLIENYERDLKSFFESKLNPWKPILTQEVIDKEGLSLLDVKLMPESGLDADGNREYFKGPRPYSSEDRDDSALTALKAQIDVVIQNSYNALSIYGTKKSAANTFVWPTLTEKTDYFSEQPYTDMLPDRFVAIGMLEGEDGLTVSFMKEGELVPSDLKVGPQPLNDDSTEAPFEHNSNGELDFDPSIKWMFDLTDAETKGMAIKIADALSEYDKIVVFGVRSGTLEGATTALEELFQSHKYTKGLGLLEVGTNTNNTLDGKSPYSERDDDYATSHDAFGGPSKFTYEERVDDITNGQRIAEALGLDFDVFNQIENADSKDISEMNAIKKVLYPAILGQHMEEMLGNLLNEDNRVRIKKFFEDWATSRGVVPSFRIGEQPYGVHLASRLHKFEIEDEEKILFEGVVDENDATGFSEIPGEMSFTSLARNHIDPDPGNGIDPILGIIESTEIDVGEETALNLGLHKKDLESGSIHEYTKINTDLRPNAVWQKRFEVRFKELLKFLDVQWRKVAEKSARNVYLKNIESYNPNDPRAHFMEIFGRQAHTVKYGLRHMSTTGLWNSLDLPILNTGTDTQSYIDRLDQVANHAGVSSLKDFLLEPAVPNPDNITLPLGIYTYSDTVKADPDHPTCLKTEIEYIKKINATAALRMTNSPEIEMLNGDIVELGDIDDSDFDQTLHHSNFIQDLLNTNPLALYNDNTPSNLPNSLSYILIKNALLLKYREIATRVLIDEDISDWASINRLGHMESVTGRTNTDVRRKDYTGNTSDGVNITPHKWQYTKWNVLFDKLHGKYMYMLNSSELSPADFDVRYVSPTSSYVYQKLVQYVQENGAAWAIDLENDFQPEFAVSKWRYDNNELVKYLRPYSSPNGTSPYDGGTINDNNFENTFFKLFFGSSQGEHDDTANIGGDLGFFDDFEITRNADFVTDDPSEGNESTLADYLHTVWTTPSHDFGFNQGSHASRLDELLSYKEELAKIGSMGALELERAMGETIDLSTYRLDGWIQGLYAQRLNELRRYDVARGSRGNEGSYIGAFGYIEKLSRTGVNDIDTEKTISTDVPADLDTGTIYADNNSDGFIMTPSITHAVTASILRSGYLTSFALENSEVHNRLSVNLSSKRVRQGLDLLDSVRSGQELGAVLGYQFEKGLHERSEPGMELDVYVHRLRKEFPLHGAGDELEGNESAELLRSGEVLDGLALIDHVLANSTSIGPNETLYSAFSDVYNDFGLNADPTNQMIPLELNDDNLPNPSYKLYLFELNELIQSFDALADLVVSEGVFQIAGGNFDRASAFLNTMTGNRAFTDPEVIDIRRTGNSFYNKLVLNFEFVSDHENNIPAFWSFNRDVTSNAPLTGMTNIKSVMSILEPSLNKWLGEVIGDPNQIVVNMQYGTTDNLSEHKLSIADLKIQPIVLMQIMAVNPVKGNSVLSGRLGDALKRKLGLSFNENITVKYLDDVAVNAEINLYEYLPLLDSLREILNESGYLGANDFEVNQPVGENNLGFYDLVELKSRITTGILEATNFLNSIPEDVTSLAIDTLIEVSDQFADYVIPGAIPTGPIKGQVDENNEPLSDDETKKLTYENAIESSRLILVNRLEEANKIQILLTSSTDENFVVDHVDKAARTLYGKTIRVLPSFNIRNGADISNSIAGRDQLFDNAQDKTDKMGSWIHKLARVRNLVSAYESFTTFSEIFNNESSAVDVIQIPFVGGDHWIGADYPEVWKPGPKVNVVVSNIADFPTDETILESTKFVGLKLDDWQDTIPDKKVTAGIAFNYNAPNTEPAQTIIQAIPTKIGLGASWSLDDVFYTILETMDMAKYRVIDTDDIVANNSWLGKMLPASTFEAFPMYDASLADDASPDNEGTGMRFDPGFKKNND